MTPDFTRRELIRAGGAGAAGIALLGAASSCDSGGEAGATEQTKTTAPPPANPMNVVVVVMDSLRADHIYGSGARTASMEKVMQEGVRFTNAYPEGMPTIPARRAIMAGRRTFPFRGWKPKWDDLPPQPGWEPVGSDGEMWTEVLGRNGWTTGYVTDNPHLLLPVHKNFRSRFDRVVLVDGQVPVRRKPKRRVPEKLVDHYMPASIDDGKSEPRMATYLSINPRHRAEEDFNSAKVFTQGMNWLEWAKGRQPFATPAGQWRELGLSQGLLRRMRQLYAAEVTLVDVWLGHFLDRLANLGLDDNTILVLASDHGVLLGEYGWVGKRYSEMHQALTHVPLMMRHPARKAKGAVSSYYASTHDIGPTVLSAAGIDVPEHMNGVNLSPLFDGKRPTKKRGYRTASYNTYVSAGDDRWLLISGTKRQELRLYDRKADPGERRNIAASNPQQVRRMWNLILKDAGPKGLPKFPKGGGEG